MELFMPSYWKGELQLEWMFDFVHPIDFNNVIMDYPNHFTIIL